ncbi:MAG TPA: hypothetical protein VFS67_25640 [Polyangiaceae bacterium]|nr:hypothetical protein [Polyangiaceae bacterium]
MNKHWALGLGLTACSGAAGPPPGAPAVEGPEDAILRIGSFWEARYSDKGLRSSPSPIASFDRALVSRLELAKGQTMATETSSFEERFILRDAREVHCVERFDGPVSVKYGLRQGEAALELEWPAVQRPRECDVAGAPIPALDRPAGRARFVLRSDQLVAVEPPLEKRIFLPVE